MHTIYKITNTITNKLYIGQTSKSINERFEAHVKCAKRKVNRYLYDSMNHHGIENFKIELVEIVNDKKYADEREKFWIKTLNTVKPNGYNMTIGGGGGNTLIGYSDERKKELYLKQAKTRTGMKRSAEYCKKLGDVHRGKTISNEQRMKISETLKRKYATGEIKAVLPELKYGSDHNQWIDIDKDELYSLICYGYTISVLCEKFGCSQPTLSKRIQIYFNKKYNDIRKENNIKLRLKQLEKQHATSNRWPPPSNNP